MPETYTFNEKPYTVKIKEKTLQINETGHSFKVIQANGDYLKLSDGSKIYEAWLIEKSPKHWTLNIDGTEITIEKQERLAALFEKIGFQEETKDVLSDIKAPMPGTIVEVLVTADQEIEAGDPVLILEAMKMENIIKAGTGGKIAEVVIEQGSVVQKNDVLIKF